jgi:hypothetical protein
MLIYRIIAATPFIPKPELKIMQTPQPSEITQLLLRWSRGDPAALEHRRSITLIV